MCVYVHNLWLVNAVYISFVLKVISGGRLVVLSRARFFFFCLFSNACMGTIFFSPKYSIIHWCEIPLVCISFYCFIINFPLFIFIRLSHGIMHEILDRSLARPKNANTWRKFFPWAKKEKKMPPNFWRQYCCRHNVVSIPYIWSVCIKFFFFIIVVVSYISFFLFVVVKQDTT